MTNRFWNWVKMSLGMEALASNNTRLGAIEERLEGIETVLIRVSRKVSRKPETYGEINQRKSRQRKQGDHPTYKRIDHGTAL